MTEEDHIIIATQKAPERELGEDDYEYNEQGELVPKKYVAVLQRNPNGVNQHFPDQRAELCWKLYIQGLAKGQPNAKQAALKAGYAPKFASNVVNTKWWKDHKEKLRDKNMLTRAEGNLYRLLKLDYSKAIRLDDGSIEEGVDIDKVKVVADISKYVTQTLGKDKYSTKVIEDKNVSHDIKIESVSYADQIPEVAQPKIIDVITEEIKNE